MVKEKSEKICTIKQKALLLHPHSAIQLNTGPIAQLVRASDS